MSRNGCEIHAQPRHFNEISLACPMHRESYQSSRVERSIMGIVRNRRGPALVSALVCALSVGLLGLWETGPGTVLSAGADTAPEFAYSGDEGPGFWGSTPGWEACAGTAPTQRQSPIDLDHIVFDRHLGRLPLRLFETPLVLTNNGHTIEEEYEPGSSLTVNGVEYGLSQFHFHTLSEHTIAGQHATMELHAVFADPASDNKAVVAQLFVIGKTNHFIAELLTHGLPTKSGDEVKDLSQSINVAGALTNTSRYYTYPGSLTTPPCTETVTWFVLHDYAQLSGEQSDAFRHILGNDFRPLQNRNGRTIRSTVREDNEQ
jgi:carbonic anhydrase